MNKLFYSVIVALGLGLLTVGVSLLMKKESYKPEITVGSGTLEVKSVRLDKEAPMPNPKEPHLSDHKKEREQIPIGEFTAIKNRDPPTMVEQ